MSILNTSLINCIENVLQNPPNGFSSSILSGREASWPRVGVYFNLCKNGASDPLCPWFGVYDTALGPIVYIGFDGITGWHLSEGNTFKKPYMDMLRKEFCFALKDDWFNRWQSASVAGRERIMLDFFNEVIQSISPAFVN